MVVMGERHKGIQGRKSKGMERKKALEEVDVSSRLML